MARKQLTADQIRAAIVASGCHYAQAAFLLDVSPDTLGKRMKELKKQGFTFPKSKALGGFAAKEWNPTPEEIAAKCAEIQKRWTARDRYLRAVVKVGHVEAAEVHSANRGVGVVFFY